MSDRTHAADSGTLTFIRDEPASIDRFGAHTRLAGAISQFITTDPELKVIGILGPWGSGKSTVVGAIEKQLRQKSTKVHFFTYDAWLHQSDPVRRSFLEALVTFLEKEGRADGTKWRKRLEKLNGSLEKTETETTPVLSSSGTFLLAALALVPLGVALLGFDAVKEAFGTPPSLLAERLLLVGVVLSLAPAIAAAVLYILWRPWEKRIVSKAFWSKLFSRTFWTQHKEPHEHESILGILSDRSVDRVFSVTVREPEPTSIEFQQIFRELMTEAVKGGHKFVFVIDNLDRLAEREAIQIWSAVRAFFLGTTDTPVAKTSVYLPTVILPVDTHSIRRMFAVEHGETDAKDLSRAFMDKTFDITFGVPEPVMSDWQDYLAMQMQTCFGSLAGEEDIYWATRFLDDKRRKKGSLVTTPRAINKFINDVAALYSQRASKDIDIPTLSYYAAFSHQMENGLQDLFQADEAASIPPAENWQTQLASIHYGVSLTKARQILLNQPIRDAVEDLEHDIFRELSEIPGFSTELRRVLSDPPRVEKTNTARFGFVMNAALLLAQDISSSEPWLAQMWRLIAEQILESSTPVAAAADLDARIATVIDHAPAPVRKRLVAVLASKISATINQATIALPSIDAALNGARVLVQKAKLAEIDPPDFAPALEPPGLLTLLYRAADKPDVLAQLRSKHKLADLTPVLATRLRDASEEATVPPCVRALIRGIAMGGKSTEADWNPIVDVASDLLRNQSGSTPGTASTAVTLGLIQSRSAGAANLIAALINEGHLINRANEAAAEKNMPMLSTAYAYFVWCGGDFGTPAGMSWETFFERFPNAPAEIHSRIVEFFGPVVAPTIWDAMRRAPTGKPLILAIIDHMIANAGLGSLYVDEVVKAIGDYLEPLTTAQQRRFVVRLKTYDRFWSQFELLPDSTFLKVALLLKVGAPADRKALAGAVRKRLLAAGVDDWTAAIEEGGVLFDLAEEFSGDVVAWPVNSPVWAALNSHTEKTVTSHDRETIKRWYALCDQVTDAGRHKAINAIAKRIGEGGYVGDLVALLKESNGKLLEADVLKPADVVRSIIVPLLETVPGRKWVIKNFQDLEPKVSKAPRDAIAGLRSELDRLGRSPSKSRREGAAKLRTLFGLK